MRPAQDSGTAGAQQPPSSAADSASRSPGLRSSKLREGQMMAVGLLSLTLCVGYLGYLHALRDDQQQLYEAVDSQGETHMRRRSSRWD